MASLCELRCLICYTSVDPLEVLSPDTSAAEERSIKTKIKELKELNQKTETVSSSCSSGPWLESSDTCLLLANQLKVIFLTRKILEVPQEKLETFLEIWGSPDKWIRLCGNCSREIDKAWRVYREVLEVINKFADIRREIVGKVKGGYIGTTANEVIGKRKRRGRLGGEGGKPDKQVEEVVTAELRKFVNQQIYSSITVICPINTATSTPNQPVVIPKEEPTSADDQDWNGSAQDFSDADCDGVGNESDDHEYQDNIRNDEDYEAPGTSLRKEIPRFIDVDKHGLQCQLCGKSFCNGQALSLHITRIHRKGMKKPDKFVCEVAGCGKEFKWRQSWRVHMKQHTRGPQFKCEICGRDFSLKQNLTYHLEAHKRNTIPTTFTGRRGRGRPSAPYLPIGNAECHKNSVEMEILEEELIPQTDAKCTEKEDMEKEFKCEHCGLVYESKRGLDVHLGHKHKDVKKTAKAGTLVCTVEGCGREYPGYQRGIFRLHMISHRNEKRYRCRICSKEFFLRSRFLYHKQAHKRGTIPGPGGGYGDPVTPKPYMCDFCGKGYVTESTLRLHQRTTKCRLTENELQRFECKYCEKAFQSKVELSSHELIHEYKKDPKLEPFQCELCGKSFPLLTELKAHRKGHNDSTDPRMKYRRDDRGMFCCDQCGKKFKRADYIGKHIRSIHENKWRLYCELCGKGFICKQHLLFHMRVSHKILEDGVQTYLCEVLGCRRRYFDKEKYDKHVREFHSGAEDKPLPFTCPECGRGFWHRVRLRYHLRTHQKKVK